jgi:hypothetical protein
MAVSGTVNGEGFIGDTEVGDYQSMSIIGSDASCDGASPAEALPTIQLSFDNMTGGNWDDRELIKVYDAAMSEFHVSAARRVIVRILIVLADWVFRLIILDQDPGWTRPPPPWLWAMHCPAHTLTIRSESCCRSRGTHRS